MTLKVVQAHVLDGHGRAFQHGPGHIAVDRVAQQHQRIGLVGADLLPYRLVSELANIHAGSDGNLHNP